MKLDIALRLKVISIREYPLHMVDKGSVAEKSVKILLAMEFWKMISRGLRAKICFSDTKGKRMNSSSLHRSTAISSSRPTGLWRPSTRGAFAIFMK